MNRILRYRTINLTVFVSIGRLAHDAVAAHKPYQASELVFEKQNLTSGPHKVTYDLDEAQSKVTNDIVETVHKKKRLAYISIDCNDNPSSYMYPTVEMFYFAQGGTDTPDTQGRYLEGITHSAIVRSTGEIYYSTYVRYNKDGVPQGLMEEAKPKGIPAINPTQFCEKNNTPTPMTMPYAVELYNSLGNTLDEHLKTPPPPPPVESKEDHSRKHAVDKSDPSKLRFSTLSNGKASLEWDKSTGGEFTDRREGSIQAICGPSPLITISYYPYMTEATPDGFWPSDFTYELTVNQKRNETTTVKIMYNQNPKTGLEFATVSKNITNAPRLAIFCGPNGLALPIEKKRPFIGMKNLKKPLSNT